MKAYRSLPMLAVAVCAGALLVSGCDDTSGSGDRLAGRVIQLGSIFSTTGGGAAFGPQQLKGARLAIGKLNYDGGIDGAPIHLVQINDRADPATSARAMKSLVTTKKVLAVLGPTFSNSAAEADPVANRRMTPVLAVSNTGPGIVGDCTYPCDYVFRDSLGEAEAIPANVGQYVSDSNPKSVKIVYPEGDDFGKSSAEAAETAFRSEGVRLITVREVGSDGITGGSDSRQAALDPPRSPDAVMITASSGETVVELIEQLRKAGFGGAILGGNAFNSNSASAALGESGKGAQSAAAWYAGNDSDENQEFISDYRDKYGEEPDQFAAQAYTGVELLAEALEDTHLSFEDLPGGSQNLSADREALRNSLAEVEKEAPLGDFRFTEDHDVIQPIWIVQMDGKGGFDLVKELPAE